MGDGGDDQEEDQERSDGLQRPDERVTEQEKVLAVRVDQRDGDTDHQSDDYAEH